MFYHYEYSSIAAVRKFKAKAEPINRPSVYVSDKVDRDSYLATLAYIYLPRIDSLMYLRISERIDVTDR